MTIFFIVVISVGGVFSQVFGNPGILLFAVIFSTVMSVASYWYSDKIVIASTGARELSFDEAPELHRTIENLSITAGLPKPRIYLVQSAQPNAFATGRDPEHAVVAVTTGILERLNKTELEGVLAHELSHVGNRDMLVSTVVVVLVGFLQLASDMFQRSLWLGRGGDRDRGGQAQVIFIIVGLVLSILAPLIAVLIQLAISRRREYLADTSGALLTRYPEGLASALEKIAADNTPMTQATHATAHLWLDDPYQGKKNHTSWLTRMFMTHPPIEERIKILRGMKV